MTRRATAADDPALAETTWMLPDIGSSTFDSLEWKLRNGSPTKNDLLEVAEFLRCYRALICEGQTKQQLQRLAALRRVYRRKT